MPGTNTTKTCYNDNTHQVKKSKQEKNMLPTSQQAHWAVGLALKGTVVDKYLSRQYLTPTTQRNKKLKIQ